MSKTSNVDRLTNTELRESRSAWWSDEFTAALRRLLTPIEQQTILDVGCGTGILTEKLLATGPGPVCTVGLDLDISRLHGLDGVVVARAQRLPFACATFTAAVCILSLQYMEQAQMVVNEMGRVVRGGGLVLAVEADNLSQGLYVPTDAPFLQETYAAFWHRVAAHTPTVDFRLGPRLMHLFGNARFLDRRVEGFLITRARIEDRRSLLENIRRRVVLLAERYDVTHSEEFRSLLTALDELDRSESPSSNFYSISTVPLFLVTGRVAPAA